MKPIRTLADIQRANAEYAAKKEQGKQELKETPVKKPKKRKYLVVDDAVEEPKVEEPKVEEPEAEVKPEEE